MNPNTRLPYPGVLKGKALVNFEELQITPQSIYKAIEFNAGYGRNIIDRLKVNDFINWPIKLRLLSPINGGIIVSLGLVDDLDAFAAFAINNDDFGVVVDADIPGSMIQTIREKLMVKMTEDRDVYLSVRSSTGASGKFMLMYEIVNYLGVKI